MRIDWLRRNPMLRRLVWWFCGRRALHFHGRILQLLPERCRILDIGSGSCKLAELLSDSGYRVTPLDVQEQSFSDRMSSTLFNGSDIPFRDDSSDISLIVAVLHHIPEQGQERLLREAGRVASRVLVMEEVYESEWERKKTYLMDKLWNFKFCGEPHSNRKDGEWRTLFARLGFRVAAADPFRLYGFKCVFYLLERVFSAVKGAQAFIPDDSFGVSTGRSRRVTSEA